MDHPTHESHPHQHDPACGHPRVTWLDKEAFLHDGHLHRAHGGHWDETTVEVSAANPDECHPTPCVDDHQTFPAVPHGEHVDHIVNGRLHHMHGGHCDDHGEVHIAA
jgi:hypothetical protein